MRSFLKQNNT